MYFSNLCFVFVKISRLPLGGDIYIFSIELKALKHFSVSALLYFKLASFYGCTMLYCVCSYMNKNYMWRTILQNRIQFVEERALSWKSGKLKSGYSSALNLLCDLTCLGVISNLGKIRKNKQRFLSTLTFCDSDSFIIMRTLRLMKLGWKEESRRKVIGW